MVNVRIMAAIVCGLIAVSPSVTQAEPALEGLQEKDIPTVPEILENVERNEDNKILEASGMPPRLAKSFRRVGAVCGLVGFRRANGFDSERQLMLSLISSCKQEVHALKVVQVTYLHRSPAAVKKSQTYIKQMLEQMEAFEEAYRR